MTRRHDDHGEAARLGGDWSAHIARTLETLALRLDELTPEQWAHPSLCEGWSVRDVVAHIIWRLDTKPRRMLGDWLRQATRLRTLNPQRAMDAASAEIALQPTSQLTEQLRAIAADKRLGRGATGIVELGELVIHAYDIAQPLGLDLALSPEITGAVARSRVRMTPIGTTAAVLRSRRLVASDAGWSIGAGTEIVAPASAIILYLAGREADAAAE